jgi:hypothetical protein
MKKIGKGCLACRCNNNLDSKIAPASGYPGAEEEATEAYISVCQVDDDEGNKVI